MSCPKCGSGAVFQGKCRECGTIVDQRRKSSIAIARQPPGDEPETLPHKIPSRAAQRPRLEPPVENPSLPHQLKPIPKEKIDKASWYAAAGMKAPGEEPSEESLLADTGAMTTPLVVGSLLSAAAILFAQALADAVMVFLGASPLGLVGAGLGVVGGILLLRGIPLGRPAAWLSALWGVAWALVLAVLYQQQLFAALKVLSVICLFAALYVQATSVRWAAAGVGIALCVTALVAPLAIKRPAETRLAEGEPSSRAFSDAKEGYTLAVPDGVTLYQAREAPQGFLPDNWGVSRPQLVFATGDKSFVGGLVVTRQPQGMDLSNLLMAVNPEAATPMRNARLVPDSLSELETQGWEITTSHGTVMAVLARAPDGRVFNLFGVSRSAALARNQQLFSSIAWGLQVKKGLTE